MTAEQPFPPDTDASKDVKEDTVATCSTVLAVNKIEVPIPVNMAACRRGFQGF